MSRNTNTDRHSAQSLVYLILLLGTILSAISFLSMSYSGSSIRAESHASMYYYDSSDFYENSVAAFSKIEPLSPPPRILLVNQHILAAHLIAEQFALAADENIKTVVLITQNNWNAGRASIITSDLGWSTQLGNISKDQELVDTLSDERVAEVDESIFKYEHGVTGVVPYVAHFFPNARIVPIVIRDNASQDAIDALVAVLSELNLQQTAIVGTIDMSHYLPKYIADVHDRMAVQVIQHFDYESLSRLDIDTVPTLQVLMRIADRQGLTTFVETNRINSADIVGDDEIMETTGYVSGYFTDTNTAISTRATHALFVGDVGSYASIHSIPSTFFSESAQRLLLGSDFVSSARTGELDIQHPQVCLKSYASDKALEQLSRELKESSASCAKRVVFLNWTEDPASVPRAHQKSIARQFIDLGADMVVGVFPNSIGPLEIYKNRAIFYSLGSFLPAQHAKVEGQQGVAVHVEWGADTMQFILVPVSITDSQVRVAAESEQRKVLSKLVNQDIPDDVYLSIMGTSAFTIWNNNLKSK